MGRPKIDGDIYKDIDNNKNMRRKRITLNNQKRKRFNKENLKNTYKQEKFKRIHKKTYNEWG